MASFPTSLPSFSDKSTENDVAGSATRINGVDINAIQNEIVAVATKVGVTGSAVEATQEYRVTQLEAAKRVFSGSDTCAASTTTTVTDANCAEGSLLLVMASSAGFAALTGVYVSSVGNGSFVVTHSAAAGTETFDYIIVKD